MTRLRPQTEQSDPGITPGRVLNVKFTPLDATFASVWTRTRLRKSPLSHGHNGDHDQQRA
jgi:hypothetical protein